MGWFSSPPVSSKRSGLSSDQQITLLRQKLASADAVVIGAGSGLSTAAGYVYTGERMNTYAVSGRGADENECR